MLVQTGPVLDDTVASGLVVDAVINGTGAGVRQEAEVPARAPLRPQDLRNSVQAIILAGGPSSNPLAKHRAMPAVPFGSNLRLIDVPISNCVAAGIGKVYVLTQFNSHTLNTYISQAYPPVTFGGPRAQSFVDVLTCNQTPDNMNWYRGSAEAVARNLDSFLDQRNGDAAEDFVILSGHAVYQMNFEKMVSFHRTSGADITIATYCVTPQDASRMGVVRTDPATGAVLNFVEKPSEASMRKFADGSIKCTPDRPFEASLGIYVFRSEVLQRLLKEDRAGYLPPAHFGHDVLPAAISQGLRVHAYNHTGFWKDVSGLRAYFDANMQVVRADAPLNLHQVGSSQRQEPLPPTSLSGCELDNVLVGDGSVLRGCKLSDVVMGRRCYVAEGAQVGHSVLLGNDLIQSDSMRKSLRVLFQPVLGIGRNSVVEGAVVDFNVCIGDDVRLVNRDGVQESDRYAAQGICIRDGIIVVAKGSIVPNGFQL